MISTKRSLQSVTLVLVVFTVFTVSLTENLQIADGFASKSTAGFVYELGPSESQVLTWTLINQEDTPIYIEFRAEGKGSEFFIYENNVTMEAKSQKAFEFIVTIPDDHKDNVEYHVDLYALEKASKDPSKGSQVLINYEMVARTVIKIGDNPVFTPEPVPVVEDNPKEEPIAADEIKEEDFKVEVQETLEEKLARIASANERSEVQIDDVFEESFEEEAVVDYQPEPFVEEPVGGLSQPVVEEKIDCGFIDWLLSLFGITKC